MTDTNFLNSFIFFIGSKLCCYQHQGTKYELFYIFVWNELQVP